MSRRVTADADHFCNCPMSCWACIRRFWKWAENYSSRMDRPKGKRAAKKLASPTAGDSRVVTSAATWYVGERVRLRDAPGLWLITELLPDAVAGFKRAVAIPIEDTHAV